LTSNALSPLEKEVLYLALVQDQTNEQISDAMQLSYAAVANIIKRARRKMRTRTSRVADIRLYFKLRSHDRHSTGQTGELSRTG